MRTKQLLLAITLAVATAAAGAHAQEAAPGDQHQQHHPAQAAMPAQPGAEDTGPATIDQGAGTTQAPDGGSGMAMMGPGMMRMMGGGMPMAGGATMAQSPAPGVTIIINMPTMPMMHGPMMHGPMMGPMSAQAGEQGTPGMMGTGGQGMCR